MKSKTPKDWLKKYYPVAAKDAAGSDAEAIKHALVKFPGLRPEVLKEYGITRDDIFLRVGHNKAFFSVTGSTCALCERHYMTKRSCKNCPLSWVGAECANAKGDDPYMVFCDTGDPEPMIQALRKALALVEKKGGAR